MKERVNKFGAVISALFFILAVIIMVVFKTTNVTEVDAEKVKVKVESVSQYKTGNGLNKQSRYEVKVNYAGKSYEVGPLSTGAFSEGMEYDMYLSGGNIYVDEKSAASADEVKNAPLTFRVFSGISLVSAIAFIYFIAAVVQNKKKANSK